MTDINDLSRFLPEGRSLGDLPTELIDDQKDLLFESRDLIAGRFEVVEELGFGGMGAVYKVHDRLMGNKVKALKFILPSLVRSEEARKRFIQEAEIAQALRHEGIVTVFDIGEHEGRLFLTMEYLEGKNLGQYLKSKGGKLVFDESCAILLQVCEALSYAHKKGVIHRDIKPQNIFVLPDGQAKLLDFGLAKLISPGRLARSSMGLGTAYYMSPEQSLGKEVDARSDIFAFGVVFYQMLVGQVPMGRFKLPGQLDKGLPASIDSVIDKCLDQQRDERYENTEVLIGEIKASQAQFETGLKKREEEERQNTEYRTQEAEEKKKREEDRQKTEERTQNTEYRTQKTEEKKWEGGLFNGKVLGGVIVAVLLVVLIAVFGIKKKEEAPPVPPAAAQKAPEAAPAPAPAPVPAPAPQQPSDDLKVKEETGKKLLAMALKAFQKNDLAEARKYLDEARALMSDSKDLLNFEKQLEKAEKQALQRQRQEEEQRKAEDKRKEEQAKEERRRAEEERRIKAEEEKKRPREIGRDGRFIAYANGTVLDTRTNLMWAAKDNGSYINWSDAKSYCENYRGGGYFDWRMPTQDELAGLYDKSVGYTPKCAKSGDTNKIYLTNLITLSCWGAWASETRGSEAVHFSFNVGTGYWLFQSGGTTLRALPVRSGK